MCYSLWLQLFPLCVIPATPPTVFSTCRLSMLTSHFGCLQSFRLYVQLPAEHGLFQVLQVLNIQAFSSLLKILFSLVYSQSQLTKPLLTRSAKLQRNSSCFLPYLLAFANLS